MAKTVTKNRNSLNLFLNNYFNLIIVVVWIFVLFLAYLFILGPKFRSTMSAIQANIDQQQKIYLDQQKKLYNLQAMAELYKKISPADLQKFNGVLPDDYVKEKLFGEIDETISQGGFLVSSIDVAKDNEAGFVEETTLAAATSETKKSAADSRVGKINVILNIKAVDYAGFKSLLQLFESNLRLFDVTQVNFSPDGNSAQFTLTTYYYRQK